MPSVSALYVYPIKACRGVRLAEWPVVERGFEFDRRWMIVDEAGGFVTQREVARLALVQTELEGGMLSVTAPGLAPLVLPLRHEGQELRPVRVWQDECMASVHREGSAWFSAYLGAPHELVYMPDRERRRVNPARARPEDIVSFADGYPFLVISEASLADLNQRLAAPVPMERFRPNIVVCDTAAFEEDEFAQVRLGPISFRGVKRCDRCTVTTIDLESGARSKEPLRTLATFRLWENKVWFGMNLIHNGVGILRVGDPVLR